MITNRHRVKLCPCGFKFGRRRDRRMHKQADMDRRIKQLTRHLESGDCEWLAHHRMLELLLDPEPVDVLGKPIIRINTWNTWTTP